jgi:tetratricopeptide (TPR) repeat protein
VKFIVIYFGLCFSTSAIYAQQTLTSDELFISARAAAFENKDFDKAKDLAIQALDISPGYADIEIFLGRVYSWDHQYDSAEFHFTRVLTVDSVNEEASIAFADIEYWQGQYENSLAICNKGLIAHPQSPDLLIRKARNLSSLKKFNEAKIITHSLLAENPKNEEAIKLAGSIRDEDAVNRITLGYDLATFDKQYQNAWHLGSIAL